MRLFGCEICSYKPIIFGDLVAKQFVLFEHKKLFGIIFFYFKGGKQDRFHTHAFNALSIKLWGTYTEGILVYDKNWLEPRFGGIVPVIDEIKYVKRDKIFKYFPRNCYHSINDSKGCMTILFQGPWNETWKECKIKDGRLGNYVITEETTLTWHRKIFNLPPKRA